MLNGFLLNPAMAGNVDYIPLRLTVRQQWVGITDAPSTQAISGHYLFNNKKMGLGGYIYITGISQSVSSDFDSFTIKYQNTVVSAERESSNKMPISFALEQNYPNPFNPVTKIRYHIPTRSIVKLVVHDVLGNKIVTLVDETKSIGVYEVEFNGRNLSSGVYYYQLITEKTRITKKLLLLK